MIEGFKTQLDGKGPQAAAATRVLQPAALQRAPAGQRDDRGRGRADALHRVSSSRAVTAIAERRDDLADLVGNANATTGAIAAENRALSRGAGAAADDAAARQLDVREPARDARRPRPAGRGLQARDEGPGAVPARAAPARARRQADDRRPQHARAPPGRRQRPGRGHAQAARLPAGRQPGVRERHRRAQEGPAGARVRPPVHPRARRLVPRLRRRRRQLRRQRPLRAHPADLQRLPARRHARRPAAARAAAGRPAPRRPADRHAAPLPGRGQPARRRTARRRSATPAATSTAIRPRWWPAHDAADRRRSLLDRSS